MFSRRCRPHFTITPARPSGFFAFSGSESRYVHYSDDDENHLAQVLCQLFAGGSGPECVHAPDLTARWQQLSKKNVFAVMATFGLSAPRHVGRHDGIPCFPQLHMK